jgi:hypothetical protein
MKSTGELNNRMQNFYFKIKSQGGSTQVVDDSENRDKGRSDIPKPTLR